MTQSSTAAESTLTEVTATPADTGQKKSEESNNEDKEPYGGLKPPKMKTPDRSKDIEELESRSDGQMRSFLIEIGTTVVLTTIFVVLAFVI